MKPTLLNLAHYVATETLLMTEGPFLPTVHVGDERLLLVVGPNASGKSMLVQMMAQVGRDAPFKWSPVTVSIRERTGSGSSDVSGMRRAMMFGDESRQSTGATSVRVTETAFRNVWMGELERPRLLFLDEPDMGLSEDYAHAMGLLIGTRTQEVFPEWRPASGVVVVTHSRCLARGLLASGIHPSFISMGSPETTLEKWLNTPTHRTLDELLSLPERSCQCRREVIEILNRAKG